MKSGQPSGYLSFTLHAHLPYVVNHGTWPHGLEWLLEAATETYLPLLAVLTRLEADGIPLKINLNLSPILLEQLAHPVFKAELPQYLERKITAAVEDENHFKLTQEAHLEETARHWQRYFRQALDDFYALDSDIIRGFKHFNDTGAIEIITCAATHGYFPLLGTDESIVAQIKTGAAVHRKHLGKHPRGIWAPECGYRPAGIWQTPVIPRGSDGPWAAFNRIGVEEALYQGGIEYFFVDTHLVEEAVSFTPYDIMAGREGAEAELDKLGWLKSVYRPYFVDGPEARRHKTSIFPRDPRTGLQVWSGESGYPGDGVYLDFHKKRWPGGHRYWQVTHPKADLGQKQEYHPDWAAERTRSHAEHFVNVVCETLAPSYNQKHPPILSSPFDAELFGHWWHEGPLWLEHVARIVARDEVPVAMMTGGEYLDKHPTRGHLAMHEGSWGEHGNNYVWLNPDTSWTWTYIYPAEARVRELATAAEWRETGLSARIMRQLCRELLLMESSDWQFLITTGAARDYAEARFMEHVESFDAVSKFWDEYVASGSLSGESDAALAAIEVQDSVFAAIDPALWARNSHFGYEQFQG